GTCTWITDHDQFLKWRDSPKDNILWLSGSPGSGKTIAMRYLIETLRRWLQQRDHVTGEFSVVMFCFCNSNDWLRNGRTQILVSLLSQILSQDRRSFRYLDHSELEKYISSVKDSPQSSGEEHADFLWKCLSTILKRSKNLSFWVFIDALDELSPNSRIELLHHFTGLVGE
ncbi:uncharacterized protein BDR25DRAFT_152549, partial [Lindgomyces ingoldianus]